MKKTYMKPATNVIRIEKTLLQATSSPDVTVNQSGSVAADKVESRGGIFGDDE